MHYHRKPDWAMPERDATPESVFCNRRTFVKGSLGLLAGGVTSLNGLPGLAAAETQASPDPTRDLYPATRNPAFTLDRPLGHPAPTVTATPTMPSRPP